MSVASAQALSISTRRDLPFWLHTLVPPVFIAIQAAVLLQDRALHDRVFLGEFGFFELGTAVLSLTAVGICLALLYGSSRFESRRERVLLFAAAIGCFYLAGEEISWGQHFFGWQAGGVWADVNYQRETNLHNLKLLSFTNQLPRLIVQLFATGILLAAPWLAARKQRVEQTNWYLPTPASFMSAALVVLPPLPRSFGGPALPERGETMEFYMAMLLAVYLGSILFRRRSLAPQESEVSSAA